MISESVMTVVGGCPTLALAPSASQQGGQSRWIVGYPDHTHWRGLMHFARV